jgi:hypothetical protein
MAKEFKDTVNINKVIIYFFAISKKQQHIEKNRQTSIILYLK